MSLPIDRQDSWDTMDDAGMVVTDVSILSKKEKAPPEYTVIENTHDGKKANFPEGRLGFTTRYLCYTKKSASPQRGFVVVTELKILPLSDKSPLGFQPLLHTLDDSSSKAFHSKQLLARFVAREEASEAIADIIVLSSHKKEDVPPNYKRLPEINGFSICYKIGPIPKKRGSAPAIVTAPSSSSQAQNGGFPIQDRPGSKKIRKAIDGVDFKLAQEKDLVREYRLAESFYMLSLQDIESQYNVDFSKWQPLANQT